MHRLFVGLRPPVSVIEALEDLMDDALAPEARWQTDEQLHLTLRFIGEVDRHVATDVAERLSELKHPPVLLRLGPLGVFDRRGKVHTLYASVEPSEALTLLARKASRAVEAAGLEVERRAFTPHITLARFGSRGPQREELTEVLSQRVRPMDWLADEVLLYESHLGKGGSHYEVAARYPLG